MFEKTEFFLFVKIHADLDHYLKNTICQTRKSYLNLNIWSEKYRDIMFQFLFELELTMALIIPTFRHKLHIILITLIIS